MFRQFQFLFMAFLMCVGLDSARNVLTATANIGIRSIGENLMVLPVSIDGQGPFDFVIDTGTNTTLIDPALAATLALTPQGTQTLKTLTGSTLVPRYQLSSVTVGSAAVVNIPALAQPMTAAQHLDPRIQGVLGLDFFGRFSFYLDYANRCIRLYDPKKPLEIRGGTRVPVRMVRDRLLVRVSSADAPHGSWNLALDSGISQVLIFADRTMPRQDTGCLPRYSDAVSLCGNEQTEAPVLITTNRSESFGNTISLSNLRIGDLKVEKVRAVVVSSRDSTADAAEDGLLPSSLFRALLFDQATSTLVLDPR